MRKTVSISLLVVVLVLTGYFIGTKVTRTEPERVVLYESSPQESESAVVLAALITEEKEIPSFQEFNKAFVRVAKMVNPSVVTIVTEKVIKRPGFSPFPDFGDDWFGQFFNFPETEMRGTVLGSGVIIDKNGYVLTNNHVVERGEKISVMLEDKREFEAEIIGSDSRTDLAVIKIDADGLKPAVLGDSDALQVGEWVLAIGSPFSPNLDHTLTAGIVSAKGRSNIIDARNYEYFIQTDAAINPGNSGGALVNIRGELVGINAAIATDGRAAGNLGIGFAIPVNLAKKVMNDLIEKGRVIRAWLGVLIQDVTDDIARSMRLSSRTGALVGDVVKNSPAKNAGIRTGDIIIEFDGIKIKDSSHLRNVVSKSEVGDVKSVTVLRKKREKVLRVKLGEFPEGDEIVYSGEEGQTSRLGLHVDEITPNLAREYGYDSDQEGVIVTGVDRGSEAAKALRPGDIILKIGDKDIRDFSDYREAIKVESEKEVILFLVKRRSKTFFVTLETPK